jgi:glucose-6-phosphate 1-epimerase
MEEGGADRYVCLEPGQVSSLVELSAGQSWEGKITLEFTD